LRSRNYERPLIFGLFALVVGSQLFLSFQSMEILGAARAYVGGEGLWSKAQKNALLHLLRYSRTGDEAEFEAYRDDIGVTLDDSAAREELEKPYPDVDVARRALLAAGNDPADVDGMIFLFRRFRRLPHLERAIAIWKDGDDDIRRLGAAADRLHLEIASGSSDPIRIGAHVEELQRLNAELTRLETDFSATLGETARWAARTLFLVQLVAGILLIVLAGTAYVLTKRRLLASEESFRQLLEQAADGIVLMDLTGAIQVVNSRACEMLGYPRGELLGRRCGDLMECGNDREPFPPNDISADRTVLREVVFHRADGTDLAVEISARRVDRRIQAILRDVSERKAAEEALRTSEERLRQATKMEAVGRLAGGVAHDFNNILTAILGYAEIIGVDSAATPGLRRAAAEITAAAERAATLTRQLLAFSRNQILEPKTVDLGEIVGGVENLLRKLVGAQVELAIRTPPRPLWVRADRTQIEQVILNLAVNARDAMVQGGRIVVEACEYDREDPGGGGPSGRCARLTVTDDGVGMDEAVRARAFEPFFTTKGRDKGTGLGLAMVYGIVQQSGGAIALDSEPGRGTTVRIVLSLVEPPDAPAEAPPSAASAGRGHETILLAEDEPSLRELFHEILEEKGYRVLAAAHGLEALRIAANHPYPVDLLVSDVMMPGLTGPELLGRLRLARPGLRALLISGYTADALAPYGGLPQGVAFLQKPCTTEALARMVRAVLDE
jgi:two-component system, cell cycle sensor histidine kinase and response regulator CckA